MSLTSRSEINKRKEIGKRNLGIELLRMILCFRIVLLHYYSSKNIYIINLKKNRFQVPCFFLISFYFIYPTISERIHEKFRQRLERLLIPYIVHPLINWIINNIMFLIIRFNRYKRFLTLNDLLTQIIIGRGIYGVAVLWFHFNLIILTLLFFITSCILKSYFLFVLQIIALISYELQYSGINYLYFKQYTENIWMSIGNINETIPIAITGFSLAANNILQKLIKKRNTNLFYIFLFLYILSKYKIFFIVKGFSSPGIKHIFFSSFLFFFFSLIPLEKMNLKIVSFIKNITKYTQGIYCLHFLIQYYMKLKFDKNGSFFGCIFLYILSYFFSLIFLI